MQFTQFDRDTLDIKPLKDRVSDLNISVIKEIDASKAVKIDKSISTVARRIILSRSQRRSTILIIGAHVIRSGVQNYLIDLMKKGYISCIAMNGGAMIHDFEFALVGATTEKVARYIKEGQFGLWKETARLNDVISKGYRGNKNIGMGEAIGRFIEDSALPHKSVSILAAAYRLGISATVHVGIGYDIIHEHPNCDGAATGALSYNDFLRFASVVRRLEGGVLMNFGSSVMGPEVFLKALSMARNAAKQKKEEIRRFTTLVCDLIQLPKNIKREPPHGTAKYYFRPLKTLLIRTIADGGESFYVRAGHDVTIPALWLAINKHS